MPPELATWVNRVGLIFDLLAFFFAAPEILGEKRLIAIENWLEKAGKAAFLIIMLIWIAIAISVYIDVPPPPRQNESIGEWLFVAIPFLLKVAVISWGGGALLVALARLGERALKAMADDSQIRRRSLLFGILLFILGEVFQLAATF